MYENSYLLKVDVIEERKSTHSRYEESRFVKSLKYYVKSSKCLYIRDNIQRFQHNYTHCRRCHFFFWRSCLPNMSFFSIFGVNSHGLSLLPSVWRHLKKYLSIQGCIKKKIRLISCIWTKEFATNFGRGTKTFKL